MAKILGAIAACFLTACSIEHIPNSWSGTLTARESNTLASNLSTNFVQEPKGVKYVQVLGRSWAVFPMPEFPGVFVAQRDNLDLNPYSAPPYRRTPQAIRAIEIATGCSVVKSSITQHVTARYFASVTCA